jgi:uncharacterized ion transporter superfamily protein YfcC
MGEEFLPLIPVFLIVSKKLGYDRMFGVGMVWLAAEVGFAAATTNPFTVQIAQGIAEVPLNSGIGFRLIFFAVTMIVTIIFLLRYGTKVKKDPSKSYLPDDDFALEDLSFEKVDYTKRHLTIMIMGVALFAL